MSHYLEEGFRRIVSISENYRVLESYPLYEPYVYAKILENKDTGELIYYVDEAMLNPDERRAYAEILNIVVSEIPPPEELGDVNAVRQYLMDRVKRLLRRYRGYFKISQSLISTMAYYLERDLLGFGPVDPLMRDPNIEDISIDGVNRPIYVYHTYYENLPTNIVPVNDEALDDLVVKLIHMAEKHVSVAVPVVDAQLPDGSRVAVTYRREVSPGGSTITIRKFRAKPFTFTELVNIGVISPEIAGYFWLMMDYHKSFMVIGVTGAGKTTFLNAMATFIRPNMKIITVEEVPEIKLPHKNWVRLIPRLAFGPQKIGEITLFDLVKATLRMRPDYLIVGEVRGEEAYVLFQAVNTGHGGISTMHAENFEAAKNRLVSPPMNVPIVYIPAMNIFVLIRRIRVRRGDRERVVRRVIEVAEPQLRGNDITFTTVFRWNPSTDSFETYLERSSLVREVADERGVPVREVIEDIRRRSELVSIMVKNSVFDFDQVAKIVELFYNRPSIIDKVLSEELPLTQAAKAP